MKSNTEMSKQIDLEKLRHDAEDMSNVSLIHAVNDLIDLIAALEKDAARYRWLCNGNGYFMEENFLCGHENEKQAADKAIDTAMEANNA